MADSTPNIADEGRLELRNLRPEIDRLENALVEAAERRGYSKASRFAIRLSLEEALMNAFNHGHEGLPPETPVTVEFRIDDDSVSISVEDRGPGYSPDSIPDPTLDENLEQLSGRGLVLIRAYMSSVVHNAKGNRIEMIYRKPKPKP